MSGDVEDQHLIEARVPSGRPHWTALDGIRGVAIAVVLLYHFHVGPFQRGGWVGVELFFVLSGYLITALLLREHDRRGSVRLGDFYLRRIKRLVPAAYLMLVTVAIVVVFWGTRSERHSLPYAIVGVTTFTTNVLRAWRVVGSLVPFNHLWSVAIEAQFYLGWSLVLVYALRKDRRRAPLLLCFALVAVLLVWRVVALSFHPPTKYLYHATDIRILSPMVGCLAALLLDRYPVRASARALAVGAWAGVLLFFVAATLLRARPDPIVFGLPVLAVALAAWVAHSVVSPDNPLSRALTWAPLLFLGRYSYGIYLWHKVVVAMFSDHHLVADQRLARLAAEVLLTTVLVAASWQVERRFLTPRPART